MDIPFFKQQTDYTCGAACMRMILASFGIKKSETALKKLMGSSSRSGTWNKQFPILAESLKMGYAVRRNAKPSDIRRMLKDEFKLVINFFDPKEQVGHYAIAKSATSSRIYLIDPWHGPNESYSWKEFLPLWKSSLDKDTRWVFGIKSCK